MIRIMYVISTLKRSGPVNVLFDLVSRLDRARFLPIVVTLSPEPSESRWSDFEETGAEVMTLGLSRLKGIFFARSKFENAVRKFSPDLIHCHGYRADLIASSAKSSGSVMSTIHNFPQYDYKSRYGYMAFPMLFKHCAALKKLNKVVAVSDAARVNLIDELGISNARAIRNGVDTDLFHPVNAETKLQLRERLGLPPVGRIWISVGHLSDIKNPFRVINDWRQCFGGSETETLLFVGSGPLLEESRSMVSNLKNVIFAGRTNEVFSYLQASDVFLSASRSEGFHAAVAEALACGLPIILSDIPAHREFLDIGEGVGFAFELEDDMALASLLNNIASGAIGLNRGSLSSSAIESISVARMVSEYEAVYLELTEGK